jgi:hypothetical protein
METEIKDFKHYIVSQFWRVTSSNMQSSEWICKEVKEWSLGLILKVSRDMGVFSTKRSRENCNTWPTFLKDGWVLMGLLCRKYYPSYRNSSIAGRRSRKEASKSVF